MTIKTVIVETMPEHLRSSHRAAGNWGVYPLNGAIRERLDLGEAEEIVETDEDGYAHIIEGTELTCRRVERVLPVRPHY